MERIYGYKSNGCGCQTGILRWFKPPYHRQFYSACELHDWRYHLGGTKEDRREADRELFHNMMKRTLAVEGRPAYMWWMTTVAVCFYVAVRVFGWHYYQFKK